MIDLKDLKQIKATQQELRYVFESPSGQEVMKFLEQICGWYDHSDTDPNFVLTKNGRRQVLATIKTLLEFPAEQVQAIARAKEM